MALTPDPFGVPFLIESYRVSLRMPSVDAAAAALSLSLSLSIYIYIYIYIYTHARANHWACRQYDQLAYKRPTLPLNNC